MADRPIIFSGPMVRALLAGTKTQTRRILAPEPASSRPREGSTLVHESAGAGEFCRRVVGHFRPRFTAGDRLWVREAWRATSDWDDQAPSKIQPGYTRYEADPCVAHSYGKLRPSIFMPRWASRITLDVTEVRVERLQDISEEDARAEGVDPIVDHGVGRDDRHIIAFEQLWNRLHGEMAWRLNPWVAAISFATTPANIDSLPEQP